MPWEDDPQASVSPAFSSSASYKMCSLEEFHGDMGMRKVSLRELGIQCTMNMQSTVVTLGSGSTLP